MLGAGTTRRDSAVRCSDRDAIQAAARPRGRELQDGRPLGRARQRGRGLERARHREQRCKVILPPASFGLELDGAPGGRERRRGTPAPPPQPTVMEVQVGLTGVALERIAKRRLSLDLVARFHQERHQVRAQVRLLRLEVDRAPGRRDSLLRTSPLHKPAQAEIHGAALDIAGERLAQHELGFTNPACLQEQLRQMTMPPCPVGLERHRAPPRLDGFVQTPTALQQVAPLEVQVGLTGVALERIAKRRLTSTSSPASIRSATRCARR